jgi:hypothetical protein
MNTFVPNKISELTFVSQIGNKTAGSVYFLLVACTAYSLTLKMETARSSETSVKFYQNTRRHIAEESPLPSITISVVSIMKIIDSWLYYHSLLFRESCLLNVSSLQNL